MNTSIRRFLILSFSGAFIGLLISLHFHFSPLLGFVLGAVLGYLTFCYVKVVGPSIKKDWTELKNSLSDSDSKQRSTLFGRAWRCYMHRLTIFLILLGLHIAFLMALVWVFPVPWLNPVSAHSWLMLLAYGSGVVVLGGIVALPMIGFDRWLNFSGDIEGLTKRIQYYTRKEEDPSLLESFRREGKAIRRFISSIPRWLKLARTGFLKQLQD